MLTYEQNLSTKRIRLVNKIIFLEDEINLLNQKMAVYETQVEELKKGAAKNNGCLNRPQ